MKRSLAILACVALWCLCVLSAAGWVRSYRAADDLMYRRLTPVDATLGNRYVKLHSSSGGIRIEVLWGTMPNLGQKANAREYGRSGFIRVIGPPRGYPSPDANQWSRRFAGFGIERGQLPSGWPGGWPGGFKVQWIGVVLPYPFVVAVMGIGPLLWLRRARREARARSAGRCTECGYDLRATPDRCPECGTTSERMPRARLATLSRVALVILLVLTFATFPALYGASFFKRVGKLGPGLRALPPPRSPHVWAPKRLGQPAKFGAYVEIIAGSNVTFTMVPIPGGTFRMGSPPDESDHDRDEGPQVDVVVEPFYMGKYEVTQAEYDLFCNGFSTLLQAGRGDAAPKAAAADAVTYPTPMYDLEVGPILARMGRGPGFPAVTMSHFMARQYTKWLSRKTGRFYRLATEAEWEYACRAGTTTAYHFGDDPAALGNYAWTFDNSALRDGDPAYHAVGTKLPNPWGLYDMHGNVAEWVVDGYAADHYASLGERPISAALAVNWPGKRYPRVIRGGGYESDPKDCRSAARFASSNRLNMYDANVPRSPYWDCNAFWLGFRVVCPVREPSEAEKHRFWDETGPDVLKVLDQMNDRRATEPVPPYP